MDEIKQRLQDTSENCFKAYEAWRKDEKKSEARAALIETVHELRKVASRLEIELAVSERDQMAQKPIPIPPHRDANRRSKKKDGEAHVGNQAEEEKAKKPRSGSRRPAKKDASGNA